MRQIETLKEREREKERLMNFKECKFRKLNWQPKV